MLIYDNRSFWRLIFAQWGSICWRCDLVMMGIFLAVVSVGTEYVRRNHEEFGDFMGHHYGILAVGGVMNFAVVFRTQFGWSRYWDSCGQLHFMYSKWTDAYTQIVTFVNVTIETAQKQGGQPSIDKIARLRKNLDTLRGRLSLVSALAAHRLHHGDTEHIVKVAESGATWANRVQMRHQLLEYTAAGKGMPELIQYRPKRSEVAGKIEERPVIAGESKYVVTQLPTTEQLEALKASEDRVAVSMYWVLHSLAQMSSDISIAPPIQSRVYQELSNGMLGFSNAVKIADVPFPFPYSQLLAVLLIIFACMIPFYMAAFTQSYVLAPFTSFFVFIGVYGLNQVAIELENPFGNDVNDIDIEDFHGSFINGLYEVQSAYDAIVPPHHEEKAKEPVDVPMLAPTPSPALQSQEPKKESGPAADAAMIAALPPAPPPPKPAAQSDRMLASVDQHFGSLEASVEQRLAQMCAALDQHFAHLSDQFDSACKRHRQQGGTAASSSGVSALGMPPGYLTEGVSTQEEGTGTGPGGRPLTSDSVKLGLCF